MPASISIADKSIGHGQPPLVIAELSGNHQQDFDLAIAMVEAAARAGADAIKLQTYTADSMTLDCQSEAFLIREKDSLWYGQSLYQLYQQASTPWEWHQALFEKANALGMLAFSSPFDARAVDLLQQLNVPCYKIASFEVTDLPLIRKVAETQKPVILSTGMASFEEIQQAVETIYATGNRQIVLLQCSSQYPADVAESNLSLIPKMQDDFQLNIGLSDHTQGIEVALAATALGACVIEKHFVLDKSAGAVDAAFSLDEKELEQLVQGVKIVHQAVGKAEYGANRGERDSLKYRRSIYACRSIKKGESFSEHNIRVIRPAYGLEPKYYPQLLNKRACVDIEKGQALDWSMVES